MLDTLGIEAGEGGSLIFAGPESAGMTAFAYFALNMPYFDEGTQQATVSFRVDDLDALLGQLAAAGVRIDPKREKFDGPFAWIWDGEGDRVELWAPAKARD